MPDLPRDGDVDRPSPKWGSYDINLDLLPDETHASGLVAVDATQPRAEIAVPKVGVGLRAFLGRVHRAQRLIARNIVVEQEGRRQMKASPDTGSSPRRCDKGPPRCRIHSFSASDASAARLERRIGNRRRCSPVLSPSSMNGGESMNWLLVASRDEGDIGRTAITNRLLTASVITVDVTGRSNRRAQHCPLNTVQLYLLHHCHGHQVTLKT